MRKIDRVAGVALYPLKGGQAATVNGEVPQSLPVDTTGFKINGVCDRDMVLVDANSHAVLTQRGWGAEGKRVRYKQDRLLASVQVDVQRDHMALSSSVGTLELPNITQLGRQVDVSIFDREFHGLDQGSAPASYFGQLLGREVLLLRADRDRPARGLPKECRRAGAFNQTAAADAMPFLLTSQASLAAAHRANNMEPGTVPITRYRGNIIIEGEGLGPFGEDYLDELVIGDIGMWAVKACSRCPVPDIDQETGERVGNGSRVLRGRAGQIPGGETGVFFGQNLVHGDIGLVAVGDALEAAYLAPAPSVAIRPAA